MQRGGSIPPSCMKDGLSCVVCVAETQTSLNRTAVGYCANCGFAPVDDAVVGWSPRLDISLISTRRFLARPAEVVLLATSWSLPIPTR